MEAQAPSFPRECRGRLCNQGLEGSEEAIGLDEWNPTCTCQSSRRNDAGARGSWLPRTGETEEGNSGATGGLSLQGMSPTPVWWANARSEGPAPTGGTRGGLQSCEGQVTTLKTRTVPAGQLHLATRGKVREKEPGEKE